MERAGKDSHYGVEKCLYNLQKQILALSHVYGQISSIGMLSCSFRIHRPFLEVLPILLAKKGGIDPDKCNQAVRSFRLLVWFLVLSETKVPMFIYPNRLLPSPASIEASVATKQGHLLW